MPFSWKKKNRFSRLVADHLQPPKHGGSLFVETGFPTSLIDLYVRNRRRFSTSAVTKLSPSPTPLPSPSSGLLIDSVNLSSSSSLVSLLDSNNSSSGCYDYKENNEIIEDLSSSETDVENSVKLAKLNLLSGCYDYKENNEIIEKEIEDLSLREIDVENSVKLAKLNSLPSFYDYKENNESEIEVENLSEIEVERSVELTKLNPVFVVLLKVLIMLVLVIGTKRFTFGITVSAFLLFLLEYLKKPFLRRSSFVDSKTPIESCFREKKASLVVCSEVMKIEEVESETEVRSEKELDEVRIEDFMEVRRRSSRRAIMKSRMKKLVPKKLRRSSMGSKGESEFKEDETVKCVEDVKQLVFSGENLGVLKQEYVEIVEIKNRSSSLSYSSEIYCNDNKLRIKSRQNSGYLVLCLIVLVGLIGGRVLAISLALSWCLILKTLQWRNVKFFVS